VAGATFAGQVAESAGDRRLRRSASRSRTREVSSRYLCYPSMDSNQHGPKRLAVPAAHAMLAKAMPLWIPQEQGASAPWIASTATVSIRLVTTQLPSGDHTDIIRLLQSPITPPHLQRPTGCVGRSPPPSARRAPVRVTSAQTGRGWNNELAKAGSEECRTSRFVPRAPFRAAEKAVA